jgi:DNA polymerase-3 subunit delta'
VTSRDLQRRILPAAIASNQNPRNANTEHSAAMTDNWDILGHAWAVEMLRQHVARGTTRHAYLIAGPPGVGRFTLALRFAQALNCTQPPEPGVPCRTCRDCLQIEAKKHPDVSILEAETEGGALRIERVRDLRHSLSLKPYQSKHRIVIFRRFHEATEEASNALLKTLEEAPSYAILILTADSPEALLPTIVSRCEVLRLQPVPLDMVEAFLKEHGAEADEARLLAHVSGGSPGRGIRLRQDPSALAFRDEKLTELQSLLPATRAQRFAYADKLGHDKIGMRGVLELWLSFWRDVLIRAGGASTPIANIDRQEEIESLARRLDLSAARRIVTDLDRARTQLEANVNARLLAEVLLLDWPR